MAVEQNEQMLIEEAINGNESSFETLILSCKGKAYNIAFRYLHNEEDALDALQESFIKIYKNLNKFNYGSKFETWVYRIVVNTCNDFLRKTKEKPWHDNLFRSDEDGEYELEIQDHKPGPEEILQQKEEGVYILHCLNRLQDEHREALILRDIRGYSYEEISEILDCSLGTVKSRISRGRQKLKDLYIQST